MFSGRDFAWAAVKELARMCVPYVLTALALVALIVGFSWLAHR